MILLGFCLGLICLPVVHSPDFLDCVARVFSKCAWVFGQQLSPSTYQPCRCAHLGYQMCLTGGQSPTLRYLHSHFPSRTANCPCCQMSQQPCLSEGRVVALGQGEEALLSAPVRWQFQHIPLVQETRWWSCSWGCGPSPTAKLKHYNSHMANRKWRIYDVEAEALEK